MQAGIAAPISGLYLGSSQKIGMRCFGFYLIEESTSLSVLLRGYVILDSYVLSSVQKISSTSGLNCHGGVGL